MRFVKDYVHDCPGARVPVYDLPLFHDYLDVGAYHQNFIHESQKGLTVKRFFSLPFPPQFIRNRAKKLRLLDAPTSTVASSSSASTTPCFIGVSYAFYRLTCIRLSTLRAKYLPV